MKEKEKVQTVRVALKCKTHKTYGVKRKPTSGCEGCWFLWVSKNLSAVRGSLLYA